MSARRRKTLLEMTAVSSWNQRVTHDHPKLYCCHLLEVFYTGEHRLDVDHERTVDGFDGPNAQPISGDLAHGHAVKAQRIRTVRRAGGKDAGKRKLPVGARMHL